jgi:hypothetical protein
MSTGAVQVALVVLFAFVSGLLALAWMRGRLGAAAIVLFLVSCALWAVAIVLVSTGAGGADAFATCQSDCTAVHYLTSLAFLAPPLLIALSAFAMIVSRGLRWRARRSAAEPHG